MKEVMIVLSVYLIIMNIAGFALMGIDKGRAVRHMWRISEATLFAVALLGGGIGCVLGMYTFHHKMKHWYFVVGMPGIVIAHIGLAVVVGRFFL